MVHKPDIMILAETKLTVSRAANIVPTLEFPFHGIYLNLRVFLVVY